jgi:hypothetical protein
MAQSAVSAIRAGCQLLSEGKAEIGKFKKQVEGGVSDAKAIYAEVTGLWSWITGLFAPKPSNKPVVAAPDVTAKPEAKKKTKDADLSYEEYQARAVHEICEHLKVYFDAIRPLKAYCRQLEQEALTTESVSSSAIDLIEIRWQMTQLAAQLKQSMIYGTPQELGLGSLYQDFLAKHNEILEQQEVAHELKLKKDRDTAWQHEYRNAVLQAKIAYVIVVLIVTLELIGLYLIL